MKQSLNKERKINGLDIFNEKELVNDDDMEELGFDVIDVDGRGGNETKYFVKEGLPYVYVEVFSAKQDLISRLIIDKELYDKHEMKKRNIVLKSGSSDGSRFVPSLWLENMVFLHRLFGMEGKIDHKYSSLNIIIRDVLRVCTSIQNSKNRMSLGCCNEVAGDWEISFTERGSFITDDVKKSLKAEGFKVSTNNDASCRVCLFNSSGY